METLRFNFPEASPLNVEHSAEKEDLKLPVIKKVSLAFNEFVTKEIFENFLDVLNNMNEFKFDVCGILWDKSLYLNIVSRKLLKLENLRYAYMCAPYPLEHSVLEQIESSVQQFNRAPHLFRIESETIEKLEEFGNSE